MLVAPIEPINTMLLDRKKHRMKINMLNALTIDDKMTKLTF